jgi:NDP-sugar pyrophosphorylase family protein
LKEYSEKPEEEYMVSMGIYIYEPAVLKYMVPGNYLDFPELVLRLLDKGEKVMSYPCHDYWLDIGRHEDYEVAQNEFERMQKKFLPGDDL